MVGGRVTTNFEENNMVPLQGAIAGCVKRSCLELLADVAVLYIDNIGSMLVLFFSCSFYCYLDSLNTLWYNSVHLLHDLAFALVVILTVQSGLQLQFIFFCLPFGSAILTQWNDVHRVHNLYLVQWTLSFSSLNFVETWKAAGEVF